MRIIKIEVADAKLPHLLAKIHDILPSDARILSPQSPMHDAGADDEEMAPPSSRPPPRKRS